jgi:charged multivesicular body protein 1
MRQLTGNMASVVKGMDRAMETMNLERVRLYLSLSQPQP